MAFFSTSAVPLLSPTHLCIVSMLMTLSCSFLLSISHEAFLTWYLLTLSVLGCQLIFSYSNSLNQSKTEFLLIGLPKQLSDAALLMPSNVTITPSDLARNIGVITQLVTHHFGHISSESKSYFLSILVTFDESEILSNTAKTIATSFIHSLQLSFSTFLALNLIIFS